MAHGQDSGGGEQRRIVREHLRLDRDERLRRLDAEVVAHDPAELVGATQCLCMPTTAVQRRHRLTDEARVTIDPGLREQLYRKAEHLVREDCVLVPLYHERFHAIATASVQGLRLHQTPPQVRYEELWIGS